MDEQKQHVKTYASLQELQDDTNKTILKDIDDEAFNNPIHYLHRDHNRKILGPRLPHQVHHSFGLQRPFDFVLYRFLEVLID